MKMVISYIKCNVNCTDTALIIQADQIAILKTLEKLQELQAGQNDIFDKQVELYTDSKITLALLQNQSKWNRLIESIRNKINAVEQLRCITHFGWIKGHAGIEGNEMVDKLAKEAALKRGPNCIRQNTTGGAHAAREGIWTKHVAKAVEEHRERGGNQIYLPVSAE